jgi:hypothetical protein
MDALTKRQMNRLNNTLIVLCMLTLLGMALLKKPFECSCTLVSTAPHAQAINR